MFSEKKSIKKIQVNPKEQTEKSIKKNAVATPYHPYQAVLSDRTRWADQDMETWTDNIGYWILDIGYWNANYMPTIQYPIPNAVHHMCC